jgi:polar amino acid transport system substrate-binding protein
MHRLPTIALSPPFRAAVLAGLTLLAAAPAQAQAQAQTQAPTGELVTAGVFTFAPYVFAGKDGPEGALIDFFDREIAPRMGVRFQWQRPLTVARLEHNLATGQVLFSPILAHTAGRDRAGIQFDETVYIKFEPCVAVLPGHRLNALRSAADLADITIGWVVGAALPPFMRDARIHYDEVGGVDWEKQNLGKLKLGRVDGVYFSNCASARYYAARDALRLKLLPLPVPGVELHGVFSPLAPAGLVERYRKAARQAFADGRFESYLNKALADRVP